MVDFKLLENVKFICPVSFFVQVVVKLYIFHFVERAVTP